MTESLIFGSIQMVIIRKKVKNVLGGTSGLGYDLSSTRFSRS